MKRNLIIIILSVLIVAVITFSYKSLFIEENENKNLEKLTLAEVTHSVFYTPLYVAIENGYFKKENIDIELILTPGADAVSAAVLSNDAEIGLAGAESAIYIYEAGEKDYLKIFSGLTNKDGQFIVSRKKYENFTVNDLIGKEVLVGRASGMPALNFLNSIDNYGIKESQINVNSSIDFAALTGSFISGQGDFVNLFEPSATLLQNEGYGHIVASVGELSGEVPYTTFYSKNSYLKNNEEVLKKFTKAIAKGLEYTLNNDSNIVAKDIVKQFPDQSIKELTSMIDNYKKYNCWLENPIITKETFTNLEKFLMKYELLENNTSYENIVYNLYN